MARRPYKNSDAIAEVYATVGTLRAGSMSGVAIFPNFSREQRAKGFTNFNDFTTLNPKVVSRQLEEFLQRSKKQRFGGT
jgi:hypothetical protein